MIDDQQAAGVEERAALHGALADPTRLRIVDLLALGDASSSELGTSLGVASNLLAHHLRTLEAVGLVRRRRSEGDGRRAYWRLVHHAFADLAPPMSAAPERVVFVCTANTARSHLAAALWRGASAIPAASAGTHPADRIHPGAVAAAARHHLKLPRVRPRHVSSVLDDADLVVTVCDRAHEEVGVRADLHWSIPDPVVVATDAAFDDAYEAIATRIRSVAPRLTPPPPGGNPA